MIVVTGAAGFIGSALLGRLQRDGYGDLVAVDDFSDPQKVRNLEGKRIAHCIDREALFPWLSHHAGQIQVVLHMGARTDTSEFDEEVLNHLNLDYSRRIWEFCTREHVPLLYASSAATYGDGNHGFSDDPALLKSLQPLNPYGWSKHHFDLWVQEQKTTPPFWAGFKFFNVYGPNEYHKGRMASVVFHAYHQITQTGTMKLFRSHRPDFEDGMQQRDFIYVVDVLNVLMHFMEHRRHPGLYNLGTGKARTFRALAESVFTALGKVPEISYIDIPEDIRDKYQYFTEADTHRLLAAGYHGGFTELEDGIREYVNQYLTQGEYY